MRFPITTTMLAPTFTAVKPAETANPFSPVASVKAPRDSYQTSSQNAGFQSWKADEQHFKAFRLQMQQRNGSSNSFSGDLFKNARNGTETFGGPPSTPSGQKANARTVSPGEGPAPLSWIDNLLFVIQSQASPLSKATRNCWLSESTIRCPRYSRRPALTLATATSMAMGEPTPKMGRFT
jgi:hypothetical protein